MSNLSAIPLLPETPSQATPGLWNRAFSQISANIAALNSDLTQSLPSGNTFSFLTNIEASGGAHFQHLSIGSTPPSYVTTAAVTIEVNSAYSDYLYFVDSSAQKSSYVIGSRAGNLADGLNIWDASAGTMIASFSKQSIRFFQNVTGPVFDVGGSLTKTYNAATFGTGSQSTESRIQAAISQASTDGTPRVYVPANMYPYSSGSLSFDTRVQMVREGGNWAVYDVRAYGATGNGTVNDVAALQGAIDGASQSGGGDVFLPTGVYRINSALSWNRGNVRLMGDSRRGSVISAGAAIQMLSIGSDPTVFRGANEIHSLQLEGNNLATGGLRLTRLNFTLLQNVEINQIAGVGLECDLVQDSTFIDIDVRRSGTSTGPHAGVWIHSNDITDYSNSLVFVGGIVERSRSTGFFIDDATQAIQLLGTKIHGRIAGADDTTPDAADLLGIRGGRRIVALGAQFTQARRNSVYIGAGATIPNPTITLTGCTFDQPANYQSGQSAWNVVVASGARAAINDCLFFYGVDPSYLTNGGGDVWVQSGAVNFFGVNEFMASTTTKFWNQSGSASRQTVLNGFDFWIPSGTQVLRVHRVGDTNPRFEVQDDRLRFGPGNASVDVVMLRNGNNRIGLATGDTWEADQFWGQVDSSITPSFAFLSEKSLGVYRSAASTIRTSYGTFWPNGELWSSSGISVGLGGTLIPQISSMSSKVGAFVVQPSSSSFTGIAWAAAGIGDIIICGPYQSGAASSISSGLVPFSFVTVAGQIEFRLSNVSTLVQNQSAQTWVFTRIRPF